MLCLGQLLKTDCNLSKYQPGISVQPTEERQWWERAFPWFACQSSHFDHLRKVLGTGVLQKALRSYFCLLMFREFDTLLKASKRISCILRYKTGNKTLGEERMEGIVTAGLFQEDYVVKSSLQIRNNDKKYHCKNTAVNFNRHQWSFLVPY